jgi:hypothetical protein
MAKSGLMVMVSFHFSLEDGGGDKASYDKLRACK